MDERKSERKSHSVRVTKQTKSRSAMLPRIWSSNRSSGSHVPSSRQSSGEKEESSVQELETVWQRIRGEKSKKQPKDVSDKEGKQRSKSTTSATLSTNLRLSKEIQHLQEMDLSPQQFFEFLNWWKEWEQGQTKARSAAEAGMESKDKKKGKLSSLMKKGLGTGRSVELILPPDYEDILRIRKEIEIAATNEAQDRKRRGVGSAATSVVGKRKGKATKRCGRALVEKGNPFEEIDTSDNTGL